jgi:hypothetical protein
MGCFGASPTERSKTRSGFALHRSLRTGESITWNGRTLPGDDVSYIQVSATDASFEEALAHRRDQQRAFKAGKDVTPLTRR